MVNMNRLNTVSLSLLAYLSVASSMDMFGMINTLYFKADVDLNNIITEQEMDSVYQGFDENGDHRITHDEFTSLWKPLVEQSQELASAYFFLADIDDNGVITNDDIKPVYLSFDLNHDGKVEANEFNLKWQEIYRESPFAVLFLRADKNRDDKLEKDEYPYLFASLDNKADGSVSHDALLKSWVSDQFGRKEDAMALCSKMDVDKDDQLTTKEVGDFLATYDTILANGRLELMEVVLLAKLLPPLNA